jgi:hypothetical protein
MTRSTEDEEWSDKDDNLGQGKDDKSGSVSHEYDDSGPSERLRREARASRNSSAGPICGGLFVECMYGGCFPETGYGYVT